RPGAWPASWGPGRQREFESRPALRPGAGADLAAVGLDYRATDGETQPHAGDAALAFAAVEFVEQSRGIRSGKTGPGVVHDDADVAPLGDGTDVRGGTRRRVLRDVVEQVGEHLDHEAGIHEHRRQVWRQPQ